MVVVGEGEGPPGGEEEPPGEEEGSPTSNVLLGPVWSSFLGQVAGVGVDVGVGSVGTTICFPDLRVMALTFLGFCTVWDGNLSEFCDCVWLNCVAI